MVKDYGMEEVIVPVEQVAYEMPRSYFFVTKGALETGEVLLCLAHGSGNVRYAPPSLHLPAVWMSLMFSCNNNRAGQW